MMRRILSNQRRMVRRPRRLIAEDCQEVRFSKRPMRIRIYAPALQTDGVSWSCIYTIDAPVSVRARGVGPTSLQALVSAMRGVSRALYSSAAYKRRLIGGSTGGDLFFPATADLLDVAPFPF
jgi:hypothetical protein